MPPLLTAEVCQASGIPHTTVLRFLTHENATTLWRLAFFDTRPMCRVGIAPTKPGCSDLYSVKRIILSSTDSPLYIALSPVSCARRSFAAYVCFLMRNCKWVCVHVCVQFAVHSSLRATGTCSGMMLGFVREAACVCVGCFGGWAIALPRK